MKRSISLILCAFISSWYGCTISIPEAFITKADYHQQRLTVLTDGFKRLLWLAKEHLSPENTQKLEHALDDIQHLLVSDEHNIVIVMVWNDLTKNMLAYLANVTKLKKHHLDKINYLFKEFQQWLTAYADAHHNEGLIVQEVYHFIEMYKVLVADADTIPYDGLVDRLEYAGYKCIEWSPLIIIGGFVVGGLVLTLKPKPQDTPPPLPRPYIRCVHGEESDDDAQYHRLIKDLHNKKVTFKPLGKNQNMIEEEFAATFATITKKEKDLATLSPLLREAFYHHLCMVKGEMELHMLLDEELCYIFSYTRDKKVQHAVIDVLIKRYHGESTKVSELTSLKKKLAKQVATDATPFLLEGTFLKKTYLVKKAQS